MPAPLLHFERDVRWENKHKNVQVRAERLYDAWNRWSDGKKPARARWKAGLAALRRIVQDAEAAGKRVRAVGGEWSLSPCAISEDFMVNTRPLNYMEVGIRPENLAPGFNGKPERLVFAQGGVSVMELNTQLERVDLALPTSGASNGQTLCGAVSTGTHGSANRIGGMQDFISGLHVVGEGGRDVWIERRSRPVVNRRFCEILGARLVRDDELFSAALCGFGSFGLVHAMMFQAVPLYLLEKHLIRFDLDTVRPVLTSLDVGPLGLPEGDKLPFHFEVVINPYATGRGDKGAFVRAMYKQPFGAATTDRPRPTVVSGPSEDVIGMLGAITGAAPAVIPFAVEELLDANLEEQRDVRKTPGNMFAMTDTRGHVMSTEIGVAQEDAEAAVDAMIEVAGEHRFAGFLALRYVKGSKAHMAFTRFAPRTCTIEIPCAGSGRSLEAYERIWDALEARQIPYTMHWGQVLRYDPARVKKAFGARRTRFLKARRGFLSPAGRRTFSNDLLVGAGLSE